MRYLGLLPLVGVATFVSHQHVSGVLMYYGEDRHVSNMGLLGVKGLMAMATAFARHRASRSPGHEGSLGSHVPGRRGSKGSKLPCARQDLSDLLNGANKIATELTAE